MDTLILITVDAQKREIAHRFEKNRNGTQVLAECPVILKQEGEHNTDKVIKRISGQEKPEHDLLQMCHLHQKQPGHQRQRQKKHHIAKEAQLFFSWLLRLIVGQKVQHHSCPAGVAAPATPKKQRSENLCNRVVDSCCFENAEKQVVPEPFDLHIFTGNHAKVQQHIAAHCQLDEMPGIPFPGGKQCRSKPKAGSDVAEIQQIEKIVLCEPQRNCHCFKQQKQQHRWHVFVKSVWNFRHLFDPLLSYFFSMHGLPGRCKSVSGILA